MSRHQADDRLVRALKTRMCNGTRGYALALAAYRKAMQPLGYSHQQIERGWADCFDMADLEILAERAEPSVAV